MKEHKNKKYNAYFSLEIAIKHEIKSYAGGLGILAGDTLKSAADMGVNLLGITLLYKNGYFKQSLDPQTGEQIEKPDTWDYKKYFNFRKTKIFLW